MASMTIVGKENNAVVRTKVSEMGLNPFAVRILAEKLTEKKLSSYGFKVTKDGKNYVRDPSFESPYVTAYNDEGMARQSAASDKKIRREYETEKREVAKSESRASSVFYKYFVAPVDRLMEFLDAPRKVLEAKSTETYMKLSPTGKKVLKESMIELYGNTPLIAASYPD